VRQATVTADQDGQAAWEFDGLDSVGLPVASGVYRVVAGGAGGFAAVSLTLVR
jgi:hypothetical protein